MKLLMTLLVRDESDIIRENIEYHLAHGVDYIIATDNGSMDGTRDVLAEYERRGVVRVIDEPEHTFAQAQWVTRMAHMARDDFGADWILNNDADEFWMPPSGNLKDCLVSTAANVLVCRRRNMVYAYDDEASGPWHQRIVHRIATPHPMEFRADPLHDVLPCPLYYQNIAPKVMTRATGLVAVTQGNHSARYEGRAAREESEIAIYHFPVRSVDLFHEKILKGGAAYAANPPVHEGVGWHWRRWHRMILEDKFDQVLEEVLPSAARLRADEASATVIRDFTIQTYFRANSLVAG
ncbi:glycosyltransferase family 2 protein [Breoghania sp. L-A4]|uniref:glycosyltransferase family 2 protein n=1 Tax=Breoghania sp. L-A4 TaxID=2304600 RepID=UPI0013C2B808|nr:glycosyltransferase family 2 protein [Breoghania sp. L-A4]